MLICLVSKQGTDDTKELTTSNSAHLACMICLRFVFCNEWIIDSGASDQIYFYLTLFDYYRHVHGKHHFMTIPDG